MDSPAAAALVAQIVFWVLIALGAGSGGLSRRAAIAFIVLWLAGYVGLPRISPFVGLFVTSYVAVLDIVLVFLLFKGDVRRT